MNYFGMFFSFMIPGIFLGIMIVIACLQEKNIRKRRAANAKGHIQRANVRNYSKCANKPANNPVKSDRGKLYIYDMNAA